MTSHAGLESRPAISRDGRWLAFVGQMDGADEVYVMPLAGGQPRRLSFEGGRVRVRGWTPDGRVLYTSEQTVGPSWSRVLRAVDPETLATHELPLADVNEGAFAPDDTTLVFTRFGLELTGDHARGYRGGAMAQLWRWNGHDEAERLLPDLEASLRNPMPWRNQIIAVSDREGVDNLWRLDTAAGQMQALTRHRDFEVRHASLQADRIVYQHGANLRLLDLESGEDRIIPLRLTSDFEQRRPRWIQNPMDWLGTVHLAANGERVALTARGRAALAGLGALRRVDAASDPAFRVREAFLSVVGRSFYSNYDASGEHEIWRFPADGSSAAEQVTGDGNTHRWRLAPSPDGKWLAHSDSRGRLWLLELETGRNREIDRSPIGGDDAHRDLAWSAHSSYLAFARADSRRDLSQIVVYSIAEERLEVLTSDRYPSYAPAFSTDGRWLYFLSDRNYRPTPASPWGDRNLGPMFDRRTQIYALALQPGLRFPFAPPTELDAAAAQDNQAKPDRSEKPSARPAEQPLIVWEGLPERQFEVPLAAGNYRGLAADAKRLYFIESDPAPNTRPALRTLSISNESPKPETFADNVRAFALAGGADKLAYITGDNAIFIVDRGAKAPSDTARFRVRVGDWRLLVDPAAEWRQMYHDAWRMVRDFLFDRNLRGVDWPALREQYAALLPRLTDRLELDDLLGQLTAELSVLHSQVRGGDYRKDPNEPTAAFLGARFEPVPGGLRITAILRSEPDLPLASSPLARPGVDVQPGDLLVAVNGQPVSKSWELARRLANQVGQQVLLELRRAEEQRRVVVQPVNAATEATLRYQDWVETNRSRVETAAGGRIGYLHLRAMGAGDMADFVRQFHAQFDRDGLILDVRRNRGGNIDSWIIGTLLRRAWAFWQAPGGTPYWNQQQTFRGHLTVLIDPLTYSDGETFAAGVKALGLGPLIGQRTAGAGVWLTARHRLSDHGMARIAEFPQFGADGRWLLEGHGVAPDFEVINPPHASWQGQDAQLQAALDHLLRRLEEEPINQPEAEPIPPRGTPGRDVR